MAVLALAGCNSASRTNPTPAKPAPTSRTTAPMTIRPGALFYTKAGSLYVSEPAGTPGRKLTDGPADAQPAPAPDLSQVAFVRKATAADYGGELWILDLSPQLEPVGGPRRLVDPAALTRGGGDVPPMVASPRWSPTGKQVAFVDNPTGGAVDGGYLLVAAADTGALAPTQQKLFAESGFAWAPDGHHIAWVQARSDVRPADVNVLAVGGESTPAATDTNASSVTYTKDGQAILFANGDASGLDAGVPSFAVRTGGIYSVAAAAEIGGKLPTPTPLFTKPGSHYGDIAVLGSGAVAFTTQSAGRSAADPSKTIQVLDAGSSLPRTTVTDGAVMSICQDSPRGGRVCNAAQAPVWGAGDFVAYLDTSSGNWLVVTDLDNRSPTRIDTGADSFAWVPAAR
ncbi:hypothetical protein B4U45_08270 [Mycobacterium persicum]|uniref:Protein TolB n=2 Tax=Mycobacterium persicum TaxID=1487726 RepID=A0A8E2IZW5_9MYCO|nr:hypothetical protein A4G31_07610 [Mycobacterium persicum]ORB98088.1 hypothetical protein B1T44_08400 [Mycobacterium persicum]ORC10141.1 hypothetical protein B4U45_08270 [Mycobacterium persicum]